MRPGCNPSLALRCIGQAKVHALTPDFERRDGWWAGGWLTFYSQQALRLVPTGHYHCATAILPLVAICLGCRNLFLLPRPSTTQRG